MADVSTDAIFSSERSGLTLGEFAREVLSSECEARPSAPSDQDQKPVTCGKGCGACCRQLVTVSPAEAFAVADLVDSLPECRRREVEARFTEVEIRLGEASQDSNAIDETPFGERLLKLDDPALDDEAHYCIAREYFSLQIPCPFLGSDEACSIYADRPAPCREYLVTSRAECCNDPFANEIDVVPVSISRSEAMGSLCACLLKTEVQLIPLSLCLAWARSHRADRRRRWDAERLEYNFALHSEAVAAARSMPPRDS